MGCNSSSKIIHDLPFDNRALTGKDRTKPAKEEPSQAFKTSNNKLAVTDTDLQSEDPKHNLVKIGSKNLNSHDSTSRIDNNKSTSFIIPFDFSHLTPLNKSVKSLSPGMTLHYRDSFQSRNSGEIISVWRESVILSIDCDDYNAKIRLIGLTDKAYREIDLKYDWSKLALQQIHLPCKQRLKGLVLTEEQLRLTYHLLSTGNLPTDFDKEQTFELSSRLSEESNAFGMSGFTLGQEVDVQDVFFVKKSATEDKCKWRRAIITDISNYTIRVHYVHDGLTDDWDEVIDLSKEQNRIKESGTMTGAGTSAPLSGPGTRTHSRTHTLAAPASGSASGARRRTLDAAPMQTEFELSQIKSNMESAIDDWIAAAGNGNGMQSPTNSTGNGNGNNTRTGVRMSKGDMSLSSSRNRRTYVKGTLQKHNSLKDVLVSNSDMAFEDRMEQTGMYIIPVEGDGNCLFRAVAHQLYMDENRHLEIRQMCVDHMTKHFKRFENFCPTTFQEHIRRMSIPGTWGDDLEIRALEEIFDRIFFIYSPDFTKDLVPVPMNINFSEAALVNGEVPIKLSYHGQNHYNSVFDQKFSLPLEIKTSKRILKARLNLFRGSANGS